MKVSDQNLEKFIVTLANVVSGNKDVKNIAAKLNAKEEEIQKIIDAIESEEELEFEIKDYDKAANVLALFFAPFIDKDALFSKDPDKIRKSLSIYPPELSEAMIKSLEMLSMIKMLKEEDKKTVIQEVIHTIILLSKLFRRLQEADDGI
ncbi:MAG: hypothetical protein GXO62_07125 [Epsilonproteobacteria bacterium]|nr:hypothetical protein [Campylobacterota bacterium]